VRHWLVAGSRVSSWRRNDLHYGRALGGWHAVTADMERDYEESVGTRGLDLLKPYKRASKSWRMDGKAEV